MNVGVKPWRGAYNPFLEFCNETMFPKESNKGTDITDICLNNPEQYLKEWFGVELAEINN